MQSYWMQMSEAGGDALELRDVPVPQPGPGQVLVRLRAAALNRGELLPGHGDPGSWKAIGGEGAGVVEALGAQVEGFKVGDRVMGRCGGAFSEFGLMEATEAMPIPGGLSFEQAAGIPLAFLVAFDMLVLQGQLKSGDWLLVNGVSSGVGVASLQLAKALGAKVIGTSGSQQKLEMLKGLGLDVAVHTRSANFAAAVMDATGGRGANLVVNTVGGTVFGEGLRSLAFEGRHATVGYVDGVLHADVDLALLHSRRLTLFGVSNKLRNKQQRASAVPRFIAEVLPHFAQGRIVPVLDSVVDFDQLPKAKASMEAGTHVGKIVLRMPAK